MDRIIKRLNALHAKLSQFMQAREEALGKHAAVVKKAESDLRASTERLTREFEEKQEAMRSESTAQRTAADQAWARRAASVKTAVNKKKFAIEKQIADRRAEFAERRKEAQAQAVLEHKQKLIELDAQHARNLEFLENVGATALDLKEQVKRFAYDRGVRFSKGEQPQIIVETLADATPKVHDEEQR